MYLHCYGYMLVVIGYVFVLLYSENRMLQYNAKLYATIPINHIKNVTRGQRHEYTRVTLKVKGRFSAINKAGHSGSSTLVVHTICRQHLLRDEKRGKSQTIAKSRVSGKVMWK